jgi:hypothetical protein
MGKKYDALGQYLNARVAQHEVHLSFAEIESIIGSKLPPSAYAHRPWWSNNPSNNVMTKVWLAAGFETEQVDMAGQKLVFRNIGKMQREFANNPAMQELADAFAKAFEEEPHAFTGTAAKHPRRHPAFGALKGTFWIEPGYDLTKPMMNDDEIAAWEARLEQKFDLIEKGMKGKRS